MRSLVAANWKMYKTRSEAYQTALELQTLLGGAPDGRDVIIFAPFTSLDATKDGLGEISGVSLGGQNVYPALEGAFTGEISPAMLRDAGCTWVLTGHSERRHILKESLDFVKAKTLTSLHAGLSVMLCIGEQLEERQNHRLEEVLREQLTSALSELSTLSDDTLTSHLAIAYEPVWAIGTGNVPSNADILTAHAFIREVLSSLLGSAGKAIRIVYGGSVKPSNAGEILALDNVNGLLVGGASLQASSFVDIIRADV